MSVSIYRASQYEPVPEFDTPSAMPLQDQVGTALSAVRHCHVVLDELLGTDTACNDLPGSQQPGLRELVRDLNLSSDTLAQRLSKLRAELGTL